MVSMAGRPSVPMSRCALRDRHVGGDGGEGHGPRSVRHRDLLPCLDLECALLLHRSTARLARRSEHPPGIRRQGPGVFAVEQPAIGGRVPVRVPPVDRVAESRSEDEAWLASEVLRVHAVEMRRVGVDGPRFGRFRARTRCSGPAPPGGLPALRCQRAAVLRSRPRGGVHSRPLSLPPCGETS